MFFRRFFVLVCAVAAFARAQEPLNAPVPLLTPEAGTMSPGEKAKLFASARTAQDQGLNSIAASLYTTLLNEPGGDRSAVTLGLATVLLDDGRGAEAEQVLQADKGPHGAAWHLRMGLAAGLQKKVGQMRAEFDATHQPDLPVGDRSWHSFLQVMLTDLETPGGDPPKAQRFYNDAINVATTEFTKVRLHLAREEEKLRTTPAATDAEMAATRQIMLMRSNAGRATGYEAARLLAVMNDVSGRKPQAIEVLQAQLQNPRLERDYQDDFRLLLGLIAGAADGVGRVALTRLLETGSAANKQRIALQLLARTSQAGPARVQFRAELDKLIDATPAHQILDDLFLVRGQGALATKTAEGYALADSDANKLRQQFPKSPLLAYSYWISAQSAWEQRRYRIAADNATKAREALPSVLPGATRAELGVFVAEAWFRAGKLARADGAGGAGGAADFRNAADAYAAALTDPPPTMRSALMFQRVLSEIEAGSLEEAQQQLDTFASNPAFDLRTRWQAEWNLARAFQVAGKTGDAYARVSRLLDGNLEAKAEPLDPALRAQMAWLQARLSFDLEPSNHTLELIDKLDRSLAGVEGGMKIDIASTGMLLNAQTNFALKRDEAGLEALEKLRKTYEKTPAAIYSYLVEAEYYAQHENGVKAQNLYTKLADDFPGSEYAPGALFLAALQAERRGQKENYEEAVRRIEHLILLLEKYPPKDPANDLMFPARLKQGDLLRRLNQFPQAEVTYQYLLNNYGSHRDIAFARLALAECHNAQSANDPSHALIAENHFDHLLVQLDTPIDVRVEAGFNLGELLLRRGQTAKALDVWWRDVAHTFLDDPAVAARLTTGRYWMARTLFRTGEVLEQQKRLEEAKAAWTLILESKLGYSENAREKLAQFNVVEVAP